MNVKLTEGALERILAGAEVDRPILQILAQKNVSADSVQRYRFLLSDGKYSYQCCIMMGPLVNRIEAGEFERYTVIRLNKYICNQAGGAGKKVIIITEPEVVVPGPQIGRKIGNPTGYEGSSTNVTSGTGQPTVSSTTPNPAPAYNGNKAATSFRPTANSFGNGYSSNNNNSNLDTSIREDQICPISQITPYQNRWAIKGRCTVKSGLRSWNNAKGEGTLFSFNLADDSGEIRITAFRSECDKYYEMIQTGKVYTLSKAVVKQANKQYSQIDHDYELTLHGESLIIPGDEFDTSCPQINYSFVKINQLDAVPANTIVDIVGVCRDPGELSTIMSKNLGKELKKRDISLVDDSETEIRLTIWNSEAENFNASQGSVIVAKKAKLSDYNGKSLSTGSSTLIQVDPDLPEAKELRGWYQRRGSSIEPTTLTARSGLGDSAESCYLNAITKEAVISAPNATLIITAKATVTQTGKAQIYLACPDGCKKKLIEMNNGFYKCDKCNKDVMHGDHRLILNFCISDCTHSVWVTAFHDEAEKLLNLPAKELAEMKEQNEEDFDITVGSLNFKTFQFRLRAKMDHFKEETRIRASLISVDSINTTNYARKLVKEIKEMTI